MRVLIYDKTRQASLLDETWAVGAWFAKLLKRFDHKIAADSWPDALDQLLKISEGKKIHELHYWGHGYWGKIYMGPKAITTIALVEPRHAWHAQLKELATRFTETSTIWFRVCAAFGNAGGQLFAMKVSELFGCRCIGSTFLIGPLHAGIHSLKPGQNPYWPTKEGVKAVGDKEEAKKSWFTSPNCIPFWQDRIPDSW